MKQPGSTTDQTKKTARDKSHAVFLSTTLGHKKNNRYLCNV